MNVGGTPTRFLITAAFSFVAVEVWLVVALILFIHKGIEPSAHVIEYLDDKQILARIFNYTFAAFLYGSPLIKLVGGWLALRQKSYFGWLGLIPLVSILATPFLLYFLGCGYLGCDSAL